MTIEYTPSSSISLDSCSLPVPRILSYNVRSLSFYSTYPHALTRRLSISNALNSFRKNHEIICLQETHLASDEAFALASMQDCIISRNNKNMSQAGTIVIDTPLITKHYDGIDVPLPNIAKGHVQLRRYSPKLSSHAPFQLFNVYFKSGDYNFNEDLISAMSIASNSIDTFICGDLNFIETTNDSSSSSPSLPPHSFFNAWNNLKSYFRVFDPPHDTHTFYHVADSPDSLYTWSSRIDRFLLPVSLFNNPLLTPTVSIPHHSTNLRVDLPKSDSTFSDHLPIHLSYDNGSFCTRDHKTVPTWLASTLEFEAALRELWKEKPSKSAYKTYARFKETLFKAAALARKKKAISDTSHAIFSQRLSLLRLIHSPAQDLSRISSFLSLHPSLTTLVRFADGKWHDNGISASVRDLQMSSTFSPTPPVHPIKDLANSAPSTRARVGPLRENLDSPEMIDDKDRASLAHKFWSKIWAPRSQPPSHSSMKAYLASYNKKINTGLCPDITVDDLLYTIKKTNNSTAGPDGVSFAAWRAAPDLAAPVLFALFKALSSGQPPPTGFNKGLLFLLPKKNTGLIADTRPLSVTNTDNRILAATVARVIMPAVLDLIEPSQKGFLAGRQGADHILDINSFFYEGVENDLERYLFLLDTAKAFDSIDHAWINYILKHLHFPKWLQLFVRGSLSNVNVAPYFGHNTSLWIDIERGVKQGCPLSPLLFILAYDPLLFFLKSLPNITCYAFADDLAITAHDILAIYPALTCINVFSSFSGLGINKDKSCVLCTSPPSHHEFVRNALLSSPWPDLTLKEKGTHLGIVIGREVTLMDIWETPFKKALSKINVCRSFVKTLPLSKRILFTNVFIISIFSYVGLFFALPTSIWRKIKYAISKLVIPFNGSAFTYESIVCADILFNIRPALKDVWAFNISLLAVRSPLIHSISNYNDFRKPDIKSSKLIRRHRDAAAYDVWRSRHLEDGTLLPFPDAKSAKIYKIVIQDVYVENVEQHYSNKFHKLISSASNISLSPTDVFRSISDNMCSFSAPSFLLFHHFYLINNSLPTSRRLRHISNTQIDLVSKCFYCGLGQDSLVHIYSACKIVNRARFNFFMSLSLDYAPFSPLPASFPSASNVTSSPFRPHLFPSLVRFLSSFSSCFPSPPPSPAPLPPPVLVVGDAPLGPTLLCGVDQALVLPVLAFNFAVWKFRKPVLAAREWQSVEWIIERICELATNYLKLSHRSCKKKPVKKHAVITSYLNIHDDLLLSFNTDTVFCYTDGSAVPNPGPCGAGASLFFCNPDVVCDAGLSLGLGTNNIAELAALYICLTELLKAHKSRLFSRAVVFSDSRYALRLATSGKKPSANINLVKLLRAVHTEACSAFKVELHWVKGHSHFGGNLRVDSISKHFASQAGHIATDPVQLLPNYVTLSRPWHLGFPLCTIPLHFFQLTDCYLHSASWLHAS
jgi:ribonuclease HI/exonuclease III